MKQPAPVLLNTRRFLVALTLFVSCAVLAPQASGDTVVLRWNGPAAGTNVWNADSLTWLDSGENAVAWQPGATAQFDGAGGIVNIANDVTVSNIAFATTGYALLGAGRLAVEGTISVDAGKTNSIATELFTVAGVSKTGGGALAVTRCSGPFNVTDGALLVSSRDTVDADISVADGAVLHVLGGPATSANLIANASFELPALAAGSFVPASTTAISNWTTTTGSIVLRQNTSATTSWNSAGAAPDLIHTLIIQYGGSVAQTVTVAADGLYSLSFYHFLRNNYPETSLSVYLGGVRLTCFMNQAVQFAHQRYVSAPLFLKAGAYELRFEGDGGQGDRANMIDLVCLAPPSETVACSSLTGLSTLRAATGSTIRMAFSGSAPLSRVYIDGTLQTANTFTSSHTSGIFTGIGSFVSAAPQNIYTWTGSSGNWNDTANWESASVPAGGQELALRFPLGSSGTFANDISGTFMLNRLWASDLATNQVLSFSGNGLLFTNTAAGGMPTLTLSGAGAAELTTPIAIRTNLLIDCADRLTLSGTLDFPLTNAYVVSKIGPGSVTLSSASGSPSCYRVYEGRLNFSGSHTGWRYLSAAGPFASIPAGICLSSLPGKSSSFYVTQTGTPVSSQVFFAGLGEAVFGTRSGGIVTCTNWFTGFGTAATYDVGMNDTLRILQLIEGVNDPSIKSLTGVIKAGPGTVEVRSLGANNTTRRAYSGSTVIRNGTLTLSADDCGMLSTYNPFNGQTYTGQGGSLGYSLFSNTVRIGDSGTAATDSLSLIANGNGRYIGHDIEVLNKGNAVTLGMTTGTVLFAGTVTLHRDITLSGPTDGVMVVSNIVAAADYAGTGVPVTLSGLAGLRIEGAFPASASLAIDARALRFGTLTVKSQTLSALSLGTPTASATLDVDFGAGVNDSVAANSLTLSNTVVNLYCAGTGLPFAEPGTYTLFTYSGTLGGSTALLTIGNPQAGVAYVFANDEANRRVTLALSGTSGGIGAVWKNPVSDNWDTGSNWDSGSAPDGNGVVPLFGLAITNPATVNIGTARTVGGLLFNNASYGYTLAGNGGLTFVTNDATPLVSVLAGSHTLNTTLNGASGIGVSTASGASLTLGTNALVKTSLTLNAGTLNLDGATAQAAVSQAAGTAIGISKTNTLSGGFSGADSATLTFSGTAPKLTVSESGSDTYAGSIISSWTNSRLEKTGSGTLTLAGGLSAFNGITTVSSGTLGLRTAGLPGVVVLSSPGALNVATSAVQGLMGYYFNRSSINTNDFSSLSAFKNHLVTLTPDFAALSGVTSNIFDFGFGAVAQFPQPYGSGGSRTTTFEASWQGKIRVPAAGRYRFRMYGDDGFVLGIDGTQLIARNLWIDRWEEGDIDLDAGLHDILIGYNQVNGNYGLKLEYTTANNPHYSYPVSNSWLIAESRIGTLSGNGSLALPNANSALNVNQSSVTEFIPEKTLTGALSGDASSVFSKSCSNQITVTAAAAFNGQFRSSEGITAVSNGLGSAALAAVNANAVLKFTGGTGSVGGLSGSGLVSPNGAYAYVFNGDADSGISTAKTYTHKLDFPADGAPATINGVTFTAADTNGTANGYAWSIASTPFSTFAGNGTGIAGLTSDFYYGSRDFTLTLSGLTPGQSYEFRLYFKSWFTNRRLITYTFSTGSSVVDVLRHVIDSLSPYSIVGFRYTADAAGTASVRVQSLSSTDGYHLYGLTNEKTDTAATGTLTVAPAAGADWTLSGSLGGSGTLIKSGAGSQTLGGTVTPQVSVQGGTLAIGPNAVLAGGAEILAGGTLSAAQGGGRVTGLSGTGALSVNSGDTAYLKYFSTDGTCEISTSKTYTHKLDFGTAAAGAICGVTFTKTSAASGTANGYGWSGFPTSTHAGNENVGISATNTVFTLLRDMNYGIMNNGTMYLTGLTPGKRYEVRFYNRVWGAGTRSQILTFDPDGAGPKQKSFEFNPDLSGSLPNFVGYRYTAASSSLSIFLQAVNTNNMSLHLYGLTNEELPADDPLQIETPAGSASVFDGVASGYGTWAKTGAGSLTLTGMNSVSGALSVAAGTLVLAGGTTGTGAVTVAAGATVCGNGILGGNVAVASNAWLHAGMPTACGLLTVGGNLTLVQGVCLAWRYDVAAADTFAVAGLLTFPSNGVVQASALSDGVFAPAKTVLFASPQTINGPAALTGWTVTGVNKATLAYSDDHTKIYLQCPRGTVMLLQ